MTEWRDDLVPIILDMMQDSSSLIKREVWRFCLRVVFKLNPKILRKCSLKNRQFGKFQVYLLASMNLYLIMRLKNGIQRY